MRNILTRLRGFLRNTTINRNYLALIFVGVQICLRYGEESMVLYLCSRQNPYSTPIWVWYHTTLFEFQHSYTVKSSFSLDCRTPLLYFFKEYIVIQNSLLRFRYVRLFIPSREKKSHVIELPLLTKPKDPRTPSTRLLRKFGSTFFVDRQHSRLSSFFQAL